MLTQSALQQWLGNLIVVESVEIEAVESALHVEVTYIVRRSQERQQVVFKQGVQG